MAVRSKGKRPTSIEDLLEQRKKASNTKRSKDSLSKGVKGPAKKQVQSNVTAMAKPRKLSDAEKQRKMLGLEPTEDESQMCIMDWARLQRWKSRFIADYIHHSPNGGRRSMSEGKRFKMMGTKAGFPDLFLPIAIEPFSGLFIELKTSKGKVSATQEAYHPLLIEEGYKVIVAYSATGAINAIKSYLGLNE